MRGMIPILAFDTCSGTGAQPDRKTSWKLHIGIGTPTVHWSAACAQSHRHRAGRR
jgi:hypothetical protein